MSDEAPATSPPPGPVRWLVAVPLMVVAATLPLFGLLTFSAW